LILEGKVTVNGSIVTELGSRADPQRDHIKVAGKLIQPEPLEYVAFHKPQGVLTSASDPKGRPVVSDFVKRKVRLFPAGRLDHNSEGLLILTNDGHLARAITSAGRMAKTYRVKVMGKPSRQDLDSLRRGISIDRSTHYEPCRIRPLKMDRNCWFEVTLYQGKNRQIRRMFESIGNPVMRLRRVAIGPVVLGNLPSGRCRNLTEREIKSLIRQVKRPKEQVQKRKSELRTGV
jgi:23S rRNA pseudouridine2605 synthase